MPESTQFTPSNTPPSYQPTEADADGLVGATDKGRLASQAVDASLTAAAERRSAVRSYLEARGIDYEVSADNGLDFCFAVTELQGDTPPSDLFMKMSFAEGWDQYPCFSETLRRTKSLQVDPVIITTFEASLGATHPLILFHTEREPEATFMAVPTFDADPGLHPVKTGDDNVIRALKQRRGWRAFEWTSEPHPGTGKMNLSIESPHDDSCDRDSGDTSFPVRTNWKLCTADRTQGPFASDSALSTAHQWAVRKHREGLEAGRPIAASGSFE